MQRDILIRPFELRAMPQLREPGPSQSAPLFLFEAWRKRKWRGHL